ncbi:MAG TPA: FAD-dependent oxidoreductase [Woeseiaceae bacterium]|nr:FAD-dependent oxidoreductase [Woeseiaceae bacterium]
MSVKENLVIGAGLMGVTSAYELLMRGHSVTLIEELEAPALVTSFANAGMLTPSMPEPWNGPGVYKNLVKSLFNPSASMRLRWHAIPSLMGWGIKFLKYSSAAHFKAACHENFHLTSYSLKKTQEIAQKLDLQYCRGSKGTISIFRNHEDFAFKESLYQSLAALGMKCRILSPSEIVSMLPSLAGMQPELYKGIHYHEDEFGDAHLFCRELCKKFIEAGGKIKYGISVKSIALKNDQVIGVNTQDGFLRGNRVVVAAGTKSPTILKTADVHLDVKPAKGYSVTMKIDDHKIMPSLPMLDDAMNVVFTPLGNRLRMVGTAEFAGFDTSIDPVRINKLFEMLEMVFPDIANSINRDDAELWAGLRPMSCDGKPFIGECEIKGLFVNSGQGPLGWTLAMGSANMLADIVSDVATTIDARPFSMNRFDRDISV